jgi:hypothetical protein
MIRVAKFASISVLVAAMAGLAAPAWAQGRQAKLVAHHTNRPLYDVVPQGRSTAGAAVNSDDPSLTGGGSVGYNQNIYNW